VAERPEAREHIDQQTFAQYQAGDAAAMREVVAWYHVRVIAFIRLFARSQETAEDIAQEVFLAAWRQRTEVRGPAQLRPWLFTLAKRKAMKEMGRKRHSSEFTLEIEDLAALAPNVEGEQRAGLQNAELRAVLEEAIRQLDERDQELVTMRYFAGLQLKELAEVLEMPMGTVGVKLSRSLVKMRRTMEESGFRLEDFLT
jgi:RNA polymerase sigma-70 factor, ECF subfamily